MGAVDGNMYSLVSVPPSVALYTALKEDFSVPSIPTSKLPLD